MKISAMTTPPIGTVTVEVSSTISIALPRWACCWDTVWRWLTVDVKAPSPSDVRGKGATHGWPQNGGDTEYGTKDSLVLGSLC